jgi:hypothetical protein
MLISICTMCCIIISLTICKAVRIRLLSHYYYHHHQCPTTQHTIVAPTARAVDDSLKRKSERAHWRTLCRIKWMEKKNGEKEERECYKDEKM